MGAEETSGSTIEDTAEAMSVEKFCVADPFEVVETGLAIAAVVDNESAFAAAFTGLVAVSPVFGASPPSQEAKVNAKLTTQTLFRTELEIEDKTGRLGNTFFDAKNIHDLIEWPE